MYVPPARARVDREAPIRVADWIEVNLLTAEEPLLSVTSVAQAMAADPPDQSAQSEHRNDYSESPEDAGPAQQERGYWQAANAIAELAFEELRDRAAMFSDRYPILSDGEIAEPNSSFDSPEIATFLSLLRSRHLYEEALQDDGTVAGELFEELLPYALQSFIDTPDQCAVRFGIAGGSRGGGLPAEAKSALDMLADRMNEAQGSLENMRTDVDMGGDAIAWRPFPDCEPGQLTVVGQATISEGKWDRKKPSPKWDSRRLIGFLARPTIAVGFVETISLNESVVLRAQGDPEYVSIPLDRLRLMFLLRDSYLPAALHERMRIWSQEMQTRLRQ